MLEARRQHCRFDLLEGALLWRLVGTKAHEFGAVAEAAARDVVVAHLDDNLRLHRLPFAGALGAPAARPARRLPCKTWRRDQRFERLSQSVALGIADGCGEADMIKLAIRVIEAEQQRSNLFPPLS